MKPLRRQYLRIAVSILLVCGLTFPARGDVTYVPASGGGVVLGDLTVQGKVLVGDGTASLPSFAFIAEPGLGFFRAATGWVGFGNDNGTSARPITFGTSLLGLGSTYALSWGSTTSAPLAAGDLILGRDAAAALQMGADVNGSAVNQTFKAHDGITGTDILGAKLTVESGLGTGAAVSGPYTVNRQITKATGTTVQTYAPAVIVCPSKILSNTSATTTTIATITTTTTSGGNVTMDYGTLACSGTTCDADGGIVKVAWNNNAGTVAGAMTAVALQSDSDATGNITTGPTVTVATNVVSIKATPVFTTIVPTSVIFTATFTVHSALDTVACQ